jgi:hypothetical protein
MVQPPPRNISPISPTQQKSNIQASAVFKPTLSNDHQAQPQQYRPIVRPRPLRISSHDATLFYAATEAQQIPHALVHEAIVHTHKWHDKYNQGAVTLIEASFDPFEIHRQSGARNPSPPEPGIAVIRHQQQHLSLSKRSHVHFQHNEEEEQHVQSPQTKHSLPPQHTTTAKQHMVVDPNPSLPPVPSTHEVQKSSPKNRQQQLLLPPQQQKQLIRPLARRLVEQIAQEQARHRTVSRILSPCVSPLTVDSSFHSEDILQPLLPETERFVPVTTVLVLDDDKEQLPPPPPPPLQDESSSHPIQTQQQSHPPLAQQRMAAVVEVEDARWSPILYPPSQPSSSLSGTRDALLQALAIAQGDTNTAEFDASLQILIDHYRSITVTHPKEQQQHYDQCMEGMWLSLTKPTFFDCLGENDAGDPMYTLGRMSFDMFTPTNLVCSLQGNFNEIESVQQDHRSDSTLRIPKALRDEVIHSDTVLRTYK